MADLTIVIRGETASGKTTLALAVADALRKMGFAVAQADRDFLDYTHQPQHQDARLAALVPTTFITVTTEQTRKG
jgi:uridine kinase